MVGWRGVGWIEGYWVNEVDEQSGDPAEQEGWAYLDGLGVLLQPVINLGDGQGWLGPLHTVAGGWEEGHTRCHLSRLATLP